MCRFSKVHVGVNCCKFISIHVPRHVFNKSLNIICVRTGAKIIYGPTNRLCQWLIPTIYLYCQWVVVDIYIWLNVSTCQDISDITSSSEPDLGFTSSLKHPTIYIYWNSRIFASWIFHCQTEGNTIQYESDISHPV